MSKKEEKAGAAYAAEQIESDYFLQWVFEQVVEASRMDPSDVLPLETKEDARVIAHNTLQQLKWDVQRDLNESRDFFEGFSEYVKRPEVVDWLADELLFMHEQVTGRTAEGAEEAKRKRYPEMQGGAAEFEELLKSLVDTQGRFLRVQIEHRLGGPSRYYESVYVNFVNLPAEIVARKAGGGAEAQNNKMSFWVEGFDGADPHAAPPRGKVKVEMHTSALPRDYRLRAKTAPPGAIAHYLADFINKVVREVPPNYTHSQPPSEAREAQRQQPRRRLPPSKDIPVPAIPVYGEGDPNANFAIETLGAQEGRRSKWRFDSGYYATLDDAIAMSESLIGFHDIGWFKGVRVVDVRQGYKPVWEWPERKRWFGREAQAARGRPAPLIEDKLYTVTWVGGRKGPMTAGDTVAFVNGLRQSWRESGRSDPLKIQVWYRDGSPVPFADLERRVKGPSQAPRRRRRRR